MQIVRRLFVGPLVLLLTFSAPLHAQRSHIIDPARIAAEVSQHVAQMEESRAAIRDALARPEVRDFAARAGIDTNRLAMSAQALEGADLDRAADAARQVNAALVGGANNITISTTTIIIILLLVILIVVAAK